jgi:hypothetical protein
MRCMPIIICVIILSGEELKTERELPPLILSQDFACKNFNFGNHYFHLHGGNCSHAIPSPAHFNFLIPGILINHETPDVAPMPEHIAKHYEKIKHETLGFLSKNCEAGGPLHESYPLPVMEIGNKRLKNKKNFSLFGFLSSGL